MVHTGRASQIRTPRGISAWALAIGIIVLLAWGAFIWYMIDRAGTQDETLWARLGWLFGSVEAVAFAAAGAIFGSSVQRQRAEAAEKRSDDNAQDAANGRALATKIIHDAPDTSTGRVRVEAFGPDQQRAASAIAEEYAALARALFPSL
jgi:hypothetical protein